MTGPTITVLIDTYNHEQFIEQAIVSVLEQDFPASGREIVVVDDGSTDSTPDVVRKFEPHVRLIRKTNGGQASALNLGISHAKGDIVAFLDGDDWWAPQKLRDVADTFSKNPGLGIVGHGCFEVDTHSGRNSVIVPEDTFRLTMKDVAAVRTFHALVSNTFTTSRQAVRKEILDRIGPIPEGLLFAYTDLFVGTLAVAMAEGIVLDRPLCYYRLHAANLWATQDPTRGLPKLKMLDYFLVELRPRLLRLGLPSGVIAALTDPWKLESESTHLSLNGGNPWRTFQNELATHRLYHREVSFGYKLYKVLALALTLVIPQDGSISSRGGMHAKGFGGSEKN